MSLAVIGLFLTSTTHVACRAPVSRAQATKLYVEVLLTRSFKFCVLDCRLQPVLCDIFQLYYVFELLSLLLCVIHLLIMTFCSYISTLLALNSSISDCDMLVEITVLLKID